MNQFSLDTEFTLESERISAVVGGLKNVSSSFLGRYFRVHACLCGTLVDGDGFYVYPICFGAESPLSDLPSLDVFFSKRDGRIYCEFNSLYRWVLRYGERREAVRDLKEIPRRREIDDFLSNVPYRNIRDLREYRKKWLEMGLCPLFISARWVPDEYLNYPAPIRREIRIWLLIAHRLRLSKDIRYHIISFLTE